MSLPWGTLLLWGGISWLVITCTIAARQEFVLLHRELCDMPTITPTNFKDRFLHAATWPFRALNNAATWIRDDNE